MYQLQVDALCHPCILKWNLKLYYDYTSIYYTATNRLIVPAPGDCDDREGEMMIGRGNQSTRRKHASVPLCPPQNPHAARTRTRAAAVGSQQLTAWATARPLGTGAGYLRVLRFSLPIIIPPVFPSLYSPGAGTTGLWVASVPSGPNWTPPPIHQFKKIKKCNFRDRLSNTKKWSEEDFNMALVQLYHLSWKQYVEKFQENRLLKSAYLSDS
jgi:hypothetical protein